MPEIPDVARVLMRALRMLAKPMGWVRGKSYQTLADGGRAYCLGRAISSASSELGLTHVVPEVQKTVVNVINEQYPTGGSWTIPGWNDCSDRRKHEVLTVLEKAIVSAGGEL